MRIRTLLLAGSLLAFALTPEGANAQAVSSGAAPCYSTNYNGVFAIANAIGAAEITVNMLTKTYNSALVSSSQKLTLQQAVAFDQLAIAEMLAANNAAFTVTGASACTAMEQDINEATNNSQNAVAKANSLVLGGAASAALVKDINNALDYWGPTVVANLDNAIKVIETNTNLDGGGGPPINN